MEYTNLVLGALGIGGILIHNLKNLNEINKQMEGNINLMRYLKLEVFSILLSISVVAVALIARTEVKQLEAVGNWLGLAFVAIGYMAQSLVVYFDGKAKKFVDKENGKQ